jgi:hypothetical protein
MSMITDSNFYSIFPERHLPAILSSSLLLSVKKQILFSFHVFSLTVDGMSFHSLLFFLKKDETTDVPV